MAIVSELLAVLGLDPREFDKGLASVQKKLRTTARKLDSLGRDLTVGVTAPLAAIGGIAVKSFADFDKALNQSAAILGGAESNMMALEEAARDVGKTTVFSATQAAEAYFFLASAGLDARESIEFLPRVTEFAQAGMFDLATATDLLTDAQSAAGLKSEDLAENLKNLARVSDVLVGANTLANASVAQFSEALTTKAAAASKAFGIEIEETTAVLAAFADQGIKGAEAGTQLSILLRNLTTVAQKNAKAFDEMGVRVFDSAGNLNKFADIVADLERELGDLLPEQKKAALAQLEFSDRAQASIFAVLGSSEAIREYERQLRSMGGITKEVSDRQLRSFSNQMKLLKGQLDDLLISLGEALIPALQSLIPVVEDVIEKISEWVDDFKSLNPETQKFILSLAGLAAALGPLLISLGIAVKTIGSLALLVTPGGILLAGFTALVVVFSQFETEAQKLSKEIDRATESLEIFSQKEKVRAIEKIQIAWFKARAELKPLRADLEKLTAARDDALKRRDFDAANFIGFKIKETTADIKLLEEGLKDLNAQLRILGSGHREAIGPEPLVPGPTDISDFGPQLESPTRPEGFEAGANAGGGFLGIDGNKVTELFDKAEKGIRNWGVALKEGIEQLKEANMLMEEMSLAQEEFGLRANMAWAQWIGQSQALMGQLKFAALDFVTSFSSAFSNAMATMIVDGAKFKDVMKQVWKAVLKQAIASITRIVVEFLIGLAAKRIAQASSHATRTGQLLGTIYLEAFAPFAGIPFIGPALGAAAGAKAVAIAAAGQGVAFGTGVTLGAAQAEEGGFITKTGFALLHQDEIVATPKEAKAMMQGGGGEQTVNVFIGNRKFASTVVRGLPEVVNARIGPQ